MQLFNFPSHSLSSKNLIFLSWMASVIVYAVYFNGVSQTKRIKSNFFRKKKTRRIFYFKFRSCKRNLLPSRLLQTSSPHYRFFKFIVSDIVIINTGCGRRGCLAPDPFSSHISVESGRAIHPLIHAYRLYEQVDLTSPVAFQDKPHRMTSNF